MKKLAQAILLLLSVGFLFPNMSLAQTRYTEEIIPLFADENLSQEIGQLEAGAEIKLVQTTVKADQIELNLWRKTKGFGRVWYHSFAKNITDAVLSREFMQNNPPLEILEQKEDPNTGLMWQKVKMNVWIQKSDFSNDLTEFWANASDTFKSECSVCHKQRDPKMHDANEWVAVFNGMVGFTDMDKETQKQVLRYLQMNASDADTTK
ncbi:pentahemic C cytochrome [Mannheimia cairinae]